MTQVKNHRDFKRGYEFLNFLNELVKTGESTGAINDLILETKRGLRAYANRDTTVDVGMGFMVERRVVKDDGIDGFVELVSIPEVFDTEADAEEFFKDFLEIHARPSMFDCTGQAFTSWYKLFKRAGQFWAYHRVGFDV